MGHGSSRTRVWNNTQYRRRFQLRSSQVSCGALNRTRKRQGARPMYLQPVLCFCLGVGTVRAHHRLLGGRTICMKVYSCLLNLPAPLGGLDHVGVWYIHASTRAVGFGYKGPAPPVGNSRDEPGRISMRYLGGVEARRFLKINSGPRKAAAPYLEVRGT